MATLLLTADWHLGATMMGVDLLPFQKRALEYIVDYALENTVDWFVVAGDVYDKRRPGYAEMQTLESLLTRLYNAGIKILIVAGNHDGPVLTLYSPLISSNTENIHLVSAYSHRSALIHQITVLEEWSLCAMPFIDQSTGLNMLANPEVPPNRTLLESLLERELDNLSDPKRTILVTHILPRHKVHEDAEVVGRMIPVDPEIFQPLGIVLAGHLHTPQRIGENLYFPGAPYWIRHTDSFIPSFAVIELHKNHLPDIQTKSVPPVIQKLTVTHESDLDSDVNADTLYILRIAGTICNREQVQHKLSGWIKRNIHFIISTFGDTAPPSELDSSLQVESAKILERYSPESLIKQYLEEQRIQLASEQWQIVKAILETLEAPEKE